VCQPMNENTTAQQVAIHEAAHILYAARLGAKTVVIHGAQRRNGRGFKALVEPVYDRSHIPIPDTALYLAAGGAATRVLASGPTGDDPVDVEIFAESALNSGVPSAFVSKLWGAARGVMGTYFALPEVQPLMNSLAINIEARIKEANESPMKKVPCAISELIEIPFLLQLLDRHSKPA
jgi:hypothetical protein